MNVSFNSASLGMSAMRQSQATATSGSAQSGASSAGFAAMGGPPGMPPPPPPDFGGMSSTTSGMSTSQFAAQRSGSLGADPVASLDSDGDGAVSGQEFGLDDSSSTSLNDLFKAMDGNGDGSLSSDELSSFRQSFMEKMGGPGDGGPPPPPDGASASGSSSARSFVEQLAQIYASWSSDSSSSTSQALSATA